MTIKDMAPYRSHF